MIWTLSIECITGSYLEEACKLVIEIDTSASLLDLHYAIQDAVGFDDDHLFEFFGGHNERKRKVLLGDFIGGDDPYAAYSDVRLDEVYPLPPNMLLFYRFDFGDNWIFEIRKTGKQPTEPVDGVEYPRVIKRERSSPVQHLRRE